MNDPAVHDQGLNEAFRQDIPKKPEPEMEGIKIPWVEVTPKFIRLRGVQITAANLDDIAALHRFESVDGNGGRSYLIVPAEYGEVRAYVNDWILVADDNWDQITVCSAAAFTRSYEVKS